MAFHGPGMCYLIERWVRKEANAPDGQADVRVHIRHLWVFFCVASYFGLTDG